MTQGTFIGILHAFTFSLSYNPNLISGFVVFLAFCYFACLFLAFFILYIIFESWQSGNDEKGVGEELPKQHIKGSDTFESLQVKKFNNLTYKNHYFKNFILKTLFPIASRTSWEINTNQGQQISRGSNGFDREMLPWIQKELQGQNQKARQRGSDNCLILLLFYLNEQKGTRIILKNSMKIMTLYLQGFFFFYQLIQYMMVPEHLIKTVN